MIEKKMDDDYNTTVIKPNLLIAINTNLYIKLLIFSLNYLINWEVFYNYLSDLKI